MEVLETCILGHRKEDLSYQIQISVGVLKLAICLNFEVPVFDFPEDPTYFRSILPRTENMGSDLNNSAVIRSLKVPILQLLCTAVHVINSLSFGLIPSFSFSNYLCSSPKQDVISRNG